MIYYDFVRMGSSLYVTKNKVLVSTDKLTVVRDDIKNNCSKIIHHMYYSPSTRINGFDEVINFSKELSSIRNDGMRTEKIYKIEFDEVRYPSIVKLINTVIACPRESYVTTLLDSVSDLNNHEESSTKNRVEDYYQDIKDCFTLKPIAILPVSTINTVRDFFNIDSDVRTAKLESTLKRSKKFKNSK